MIDGELTESRILVVGEESSARELTEMLAREGFSHFRTGHGPEKAIRECMEWRPDLILLDLALPGVSPVGFIHELQYGDGASFEGPPPEIVVVTNVEQEGMLRRLVEAGVSGVVLKEVRPLDLALEVRNRLEARMLSRRLTNGDRREDEIREAGEAGGGDLGVLKTLARLVEFRDFKTERHSERVGELSARIAEEMGLEPERIRMLREAAPLHDVGMVLVPDRILLKEGELTPGERDIMKTHAANGARILSESDVPVMRLAREIAHTHHERWDGKGYPRGLEGEEIPLEGRIVAVADAFEAITHDRPFREAESAGRALEEVRRERGRQFDPEVADALIQIKEREGVEAA